MLIGCVGYRNLRDLSVGPELLGQLAERPWPPAVEVEDFSFGPIAMVQRLEDRPAYRRAVFLTGVERGRTPGQITTYTWDGRLPDADEIQARVAEAVTGVISLDNLLVVAGYHRALPPEVVVVEVEPEDTGWGEGFSSTVQAVVPDVLKAVEAAASR